MRWYLGALIVLMGSTQPAGAEDGYVQAAEKILHDQNLATDGPALLEFFRRRTLSKSRLSALADQVQQLGSNSFRERQRASKELVLAGQAGQSLLQGVLQDSRADLEILHRAELCLRRLRDEASLAGASARLLGQRKPPGAAETLINYLPFAPGPTVLEDIQEVLPALALPLGRPDPVLVHALTDPKPIKRASAGAALVRAGALGQLPNLRILLKDPDSLVRLHLARALIQVHDKSGIPVLIDLMPVLPTPLVGEVEELLVLIAGDNSPRVLVDPRHPPAQAATAWSAWWRDHQATLDLGKVDPLSRQRGYTLITQMDSRGVSGRVFEIRPNQQILWQINGLRYPLDAQVIGKDRVLIAEYLNRRGPARH